MANKEKESKLTVPAEKEFNGETVKTMLQEKVDIHNKLVTDKDQLVAKLQEVETALRENVGGIKSMQGVLDEYFRKDKPSGNGQA